MSIILNLSPCKQTRELNAAGFCLNPAKAINKWKSKGFLSGLRLAKQIAKRPNEQNGQVATLKNAFFSDSWHLGL